MFTAALVLATLLQAPSVQAQSPSTLVDDAGRLAAATSNEGRFDALTALLKARGLTLTVEPFTLEKAVGREPRTEGRNIVVTIGDGAETILIGAHYDAARIPDGTLSRGQSTMPPRASC
jgi:acetylornithine deacetylase/succinyl-diaminopimelate desuccinylase-like protein